MAPWEAAPASFRIALRPQPINATASVQPVIDFSLALEALDVTKVGAGIVSLDLPLVLGDALVFEFDSGFAHAAVMAAFRWHGQRSCSWRPGCRPTGADMTAHPRERFRWSVDAVNMRPPRDPNDDDDDGEEKNGEDESEDDEPAVIREPDE